ncbi:MAG: TOBE domain-containing protein, partial [Devosia sp.]|nr:TOBE domain-containing protein [Devosia sp.]
ALADLPVGAAVRVRIPAREVILARTDAGAFAGTLSLHNVLSGTVRAIAPHPARHAALVEVAVGEASLLSRITPDAVARLGLAPGAPVAALIKSMSIEILDGAAAAVP